MTYFDPRQTVISQYANSPVLLDVIDRLCAAIDQTANIDLLYDMVWNVDTAQGYGLDVLGRRVGVGRVLQIPDAPADAFGFEEATDAFGFGQAPFNRGAAGTTSNYALSDTAFRRLVLAKAASNITDASVPSINAILMLLFPGYGNCYVRDNLDMTMTLVFGATLTPVDLAIVSSSGALPRPAGVSFTVEDA